LSGGTRLDRLLVQRPRDRRRPAPLGHVLHDHRPTEVTDRDLDGVPRTHLLRRLHPLVVDVDAAAEYSLRRGAARLVKARRPEPLVDPHCIREASRSCFAAATDLAGPAYFG